MPSTSPPGWLWQTVRWGWLLTLLTLVGLTTALAQGLTDPPRAGPLRWNEDFKGDLARWTLAGDGGQMQFDRQALYATFATADGAQWQAALTDQPAERFTLEVAAAQATGEIGIAYGLIFGWQDANHYQAVLINGNGYATAYRQAGAERQTWYAWQQWPHILFGAEANRIRIDVQGERVIARVNDERLAETITDPTGQVGVLAYGYTAGEVVFGWVQVWGR